MTTITIQLNDSKLIDYLRFRFEAKDNEPVKINRADNIGKHIFGLLTYSDYPTPQIGNTVLQLPSLEKYRNEKRFQFIRPENQLLLADYIESVLILDYQMFMTIAIELGYKFKKALELFIESRGFSEDCIEAFKKNDYRHRQKVKEYLINCQQLSINQCNKKFYKELSTKKDKSLQNEPICLY